MLHHPAASTARRCAITRRGDAFFTLDLSAFQRSPSAPDGTPRGGSTFPASLHAHVVDDSSIRSLRHIRAAGLGIPVRQQQDHIAPATRALFHLDKNGVIF